MKAFVATLEGISPYAQSRYHGTPEFERELPDAYEKRTWRNKAHVNKEGYIYIPPNVFKNSLSEAAQYKNEKIPGKGNETWTKHFVAGVSVMECLVLPVKKEEARDLWLFVPSDGKRGGTKRVFKCFPVIDEWKGDVTYYIWDDIITLSKFKEYLEECGKFIGLGMSRPRNNGWFGRFKVLNVKETNVT